MGYRSPHLGLLNEFMIVQAGSRCTIDSGAVSWHEALHRSWGSSIWEARVALWAYLSSHESSNSGCVQIFICAGREQIGASVLCNTTRKAKEGKAGQSPHPKVAFLLE